METDVGRCLFCCIKSRDGYLATSFVSYLSSSLHNCVLTFKSRWDEWVPASRLLKMTETNVALQKSLQHTNVPSGAHGGAASAKINPKNTGVKDSVSTRAGARKDGTRGTKRGREDVRSFVLLFRCYLFGCLLLLR